MLVLVELVLAAVGVAPLTAREDPFHGFSEALAGFRGRRGRRRPPHAGARGDALVQPAGVSARAKSSDELRIFVLGGSSAYGFPWGAERAFSSILERALQASLPERDVHVVNAAAMSYGSHRLRILTHELLEYSPDLLLLYTGHNEFVERELYERLTDAEPLPEGLRLWLHRWRLYSALARLLSPAP